MSPRTNYDSNFCGSLPLHLTNLVQSYGYLLVLDLAGLRIVQLSENSEELFGQPVEKVVGQSFSDYLSPADIANLEEKLASGIREKIPFNFTFGESKREVLALVHLRDDHILAELEPVSPAHKKGFTEVYNEIRYVIAAIDTAETLGQASAIAVRELKKLSGFDKIMMYRFDEEWNGTVIAEIMEEGMEPYMGLTFPASDVPKQARALYLKNPYRLIPDREYTPVRLYPVINPITQSFLDLSDCNLRSVAAVHIEYLRNMKVTASMSTRVIRNGELWGLISCHHREPKYLDQESCSIFELLSDVISSRIDHIIRKEEYDFSNRLQQNYAKLVEYIYSENDFVSGLLKDDVNVMDFLGAGGVAITGRGRTGTLGNVPDAEKIENLVLWLQAKGIDHVYTEANLAAVYDGAADYSAIASGIIVVPIDAEEGHYVIGFRPEVIKDINWGGNPNEAIHFEPGKNNYHPRHSFQVWQERVKDTAIAWSEQEINWAERLRNFIFEYNIKHS
ncbi:GAF domain-containing protein [Hufsiella ginkgonis]|uniref:GAF domain-containing protein n=1 Tax=Hufsiella ginkgonis TaxID=2695274 RepID=A0A7K1Y136_9SPHI|nr:GAF domain-containing protein [Hufsiella ginkgonis]MXV16922.1 GAF domain-containing protein [Hufsiella ginkgonis]